MELPKVLKDKKAIINIENMNEKCFLWAIIAGTYLKDVKCQNPERPARYREYESKFNLDGILFPVALHDIPKFERKNNISISVYGL